MGGSLVVRDTINLGSELAADRPLVEEADSWVGDALWVAGARDGDAGLVLLSASGSFGGFEDVDDGGLSAIDLSTVEIGSDGLLYAAANDGNGLWTIDGTPSALILQTQFQDTTETFLANVGLIGTVPILGADVVLGVSTSEVGVTALWRSQEIVGDVTVFGPLEVGQSRGPDDGLGIMQPRDLTYVVIDGGTFAVLASSPNVGASGALTVFEVGSDGGLTPTDHVIDSLYTRFGGDTSVEAIEVDGRAFIVAGGNDAGLALFELTPRGKLIHLQSIEDTTSIGLDGPQAIALLESGPSIEVLVASEGAAGLAHLRIDAPTGISLSQNGGMLTGSGGEDLLEGGTLAETIAGGNGADIILDGGGSDQLTGGNSADLFILAGDGAHDTISDFDVSQDRLDLSDWPFLYTPSVLTVTERSWGADVSYRDETLSLYSANGQPITKAQLAGTVVEALYRIFFVNSFEITGTTAAELLVGDWGPDTLIGGGGADTIRGDGGGDLIEGGMEPDGALWRRG